MVGLPRSAAHIVLLGFALGLYVASADGARAPRSPDPPDRPESEDLWAFTMAASHVDPPNTSLATGNGTVTRAGDRVNITMSWEGLSGPLTGAHLHGQSASGVEAGVLFSLVPGAAPEGSTSPIEASFDLTQEALQMLREGLVYADIHTAVYPQGEIRGPVTDAADDLAGDEGELGEEDAYDGDPGEEAAGESNLGDDEESGEDWLVE